MESTLTSHGIRAPLPRSPAKPARHALPPAPFPRSLRSSRWALGLLQAEGGPLELVLGGGLGLLQGAQGGEVPAHRLRGRGVPLPPLARRGGGPGRGAGTRQPAVRQRRPSSCTRKWEKGGRRIETWIDATNIFFNFWGMMSVSGSRWGSSRGASKETHLQQGKA